MEIIAKHDENQREIVTMGKIHEMFDKNCLTQNVLGRLANRTTGSNGLAGKYRIPIKLHAQLITIC